jgi:hypothetical protein
MFCTLTANAEDTTNLSLGVKLLAVNWTGENTDSGTDLKSTSGGQFGWNIAIQKKRLYGGLSLQGGNYQFDDVGPDQVTDTTTTQVTNVNVERSEFDLIAGYYFWKNISLFLDLKSIQNKYDKNDYKQQFTGLGFGASGAWALNKNWSLYGTFGFVGRADLKANEKVVGDVDSSAFEFGGNYRFKKSHRFNVGIKTQQQNYTFNDGTKQIHKFGGVFFGYNYVFSL